MGLKQTFKFLKNMYSLEQCILIIISDLNPPTSDLWILHLTGILFIYMNLIMDLAHGRVSVAQ